MSFLNTAIAKDRAYMRGQLGFNAFSRMKTMLAAGKDVSVLICSDSLGNNSYEYARVTASDWAALYPTSAVYYILVNQGAPYSSWGATETVQAGTGGPSITIYNVALTGTRPDFLLGKRKAFALETASPEVIIFCYGGNDFVGVQPAVIRGNFWRWILEMDYLHPGVPIAAIREPPFREDNANAVNHDTIMIPAWDRVTAACPNVTVLDAWTEFMSHNPDRSPTSPLYTDNIHLSAEGQLLSILPPLREAFNSAALGGNLPALGLASPRANLIHGGDLATWSAGLPVSDNGVFSVTGSAVVALVAAPSDRSDQYMTIASNGVANGRLRWAANSTYLGLLRGKSVTLNVRMRVPDGNVADSGRVTIATGTADPNSTRASAEQHGDWNFYTVADYKVPADASYLYIEVSPDSGTSTGQVVDVDSIVLAAGGSPHCA